jgi:uncharacterized phage protein (TIGR02218 family)
MRTLPPGLQAHLDSGATTLALAWRVTRADGTVQGFTEHDADLSFDSTLFAARSGFTGSAIASELGLAATDADIAGALDAETITENDLIAGRYDAARVETFAVNWQDTTQHLLLHAGEIGEVRRTGRAFRAELRGLAERLNVPIGRTYQPLCDAALGDARCRVTLTPQTATLLAAPAPHALTTQDLGSHPDGHFAHGTLLWETGMNAGTRADIRTHASANGIATLTLWREPPFPPAPGDAFTVLPGCDKTFAACKEKFANHLNFRGFPAMPGNDWLTAGPSQSEPRDGGARA